MTTTAIVFMSTSVLAVTVLAGWCYYRVLKRPADGNDDKADQNLS